MIQKYLKRVFIIIIIISILLSNSTFAAVIITGEQSTNNDEWDQQMTVEGTSEEGTKFSEKVTGETEEERKSQREEAYTIQTKIEKELEKQLKEDMASSAKYEIDYVIYYSETELEDNIREVWKTSKNVEMSDEYVQKIMNLCKTNITEYGYKKIDLWFEQYYSNNKDLIVSKIEEYVDNDESFIESGVSIVLFTAVTPIEDEVERITQGIIDNIPNTVKKIVDGTKTTENWASLALNKICTELVVDITNAFESGFGTGFEWQDEKLLQAFRDIGSFSSDVSDEFANEVSNNLSTALDHYLGYPSSWDWKDKLIEFAFNKVDGTLGEQLKLVTNIIEEKTLSPQQIQMYYNDYNRLVEQKKNAAKKEQQDKLKDAQKETSESKRKELEGKANDEYQAKLKEIEKEADKEAREKLKNTAYDEYKNKLESIDNQIKSDNAEILNKEANALIAGVLREANIQFKDMDFETLIINNNKTEIDKQQDADLEKLDEDFGLKLSDEKKKAQNLEKITENERHENRDSEIYQQYKQELTQAEKDSKEALTVMEKTQNEQNKTNLDMAYGQVPTVEQEQAKGNALKQVDEEEKEELAKLGNEYVEYKKQVEELEKKINNAEEAAEQKRDERIEEAKKEWGQEEITDEQKEERKLMYKIIEAEKKNADTITRIKYGRELSDEKKEERDERLEKSKEAEKTNLQKYQVQYGLALSNEMQTKLDNEIKELNSNYHNEIGPLLQKIQTPMSQSEWNNLWNNLETISKSREAAEKTIRNKAEYQTKDLSDLKPEEKQAYNTLVTNEKNTRKAERVEIESEYELKPIDVIDGIKYEDAMNKIDNEEDAAKKIVDEMYSKRKLSETEELAYKAAIEDANKDCEDEKKSLDSLRNDLKELKDKNDDFEDKEDEIREKADDKRETINDSAEYKAKGFPGDTEEERKKNEEIYNQLKESEKERHEKRIEEIEEMYSKKKLSPEEKAEMKKLLNAEDELHKSNKQKIEDNYKTIDKEDLSPEKKAEYEELQKKIKEDAKKKKEEEAARIKAAKEAYKAKLQQIEINYEQAIELLDSDYDATKNQLEADYAAGKISKEEYKAQKNSLKEEYEKQKAQLVAGKQRILDEERNNWAKEKVYAYNFSKMFVMQLAGDYTNDLMYDIERDIAEWSEKLGDFGSAVVTAVAREVTNWVKTEIVRNFGILYDQMWGTTASSLGVREFKFDWKNLGINVMYFWAMNNEFLASVLSGVGGFVASATGFTYEALAGLNFGFIARPFVTLLPTNNFLTAVVVAEKYAKESRDIGDSGKWRGNPFGTFEMLGYNPLQFLPTGSTTMFANIIPHIYNDATGLMPSSGFYEIHRSFSPLPLSTFIMFNVSGATVIPKYPILSYPWVGPYFDAAYVASEFGSNFGNDSYVQRAFSYTSVAMLAGGSGGNILEATPDSVTTTGGSIAGIGGQLVFEPTVYSTALVKEAQKYAEFATKVTLAAGYPNSLKDLTNQEALKTRYIHEQDLVVIGPFKVDYIKSGVQTEFRNTNFGMMVDMKIYYRDEATMEEKQISKDTWTLLFEENGEIDFAFSDDREGSDYIYPYPKEEFYIAINKSANPNVTSLSRIRMDFKELQTSMAGHFHDMSYMMHMSVSKIIIIPPGPTDVGPQFLKSITRAPTGMVYLDNALFSVMYAKRFYMNWHMDIILGNKAQKTPAYETADYYTTQYEIVTNVWGGQVDKEDILYGDETNSSLYNSLESLLKNYNTENKEQYNSSGSTFVESVTNASQIYTSAYGDTGYTNAINAVLKSTAENDATKVLTTFEKITTEDNDDFQKIAIMAQELSKKEHVRELATIMETVVEIYKNTNDNIGREILNLLNEIVILYDDADYDAIVDSINTIINNCDYKEEVFTLLSQKSEISLTDAVMVNYLKTRYPRLDEDRRALVMATTRSIESVVNNTGDKGNIIGQIIEKACKVHEGKEVISELLAVIVNNSNDEELQKEYRSIVSIMQINSKITQINSSEALTDAEKYKYTQEEQVKMYKAISIVGKALNAGESVIDSIEKAYGETSNIEKNVFTKFQDVVKDLHQNEVNKLTQSLVKSTDIETTLDIVNTEYLRNNLKGETEKAQTFVEILEESSAIYDTTPYTRYDTDYNIMNRDNSGEQPYYMAAESTGFTLSFGGVVWKDGHTGLQNDYDGVRKANTNGYLEEGIEGVQVTLIDADTNEIGKMMVEGKWQPAITYTDEGGYYHFEKVQLGQYYVNFTYDGQKYMATTSLSDGEKKTSVDDYTFVSDLEMYDNNSKAAENVDERRAFNNKFYEIRQNAAYSKDGEMLNVDGKNVSLEYVEKDGAAELITLDSAGHVLPQFAMTASTKELVGSKYGLAENGLHYPINSNVTLDNEKTTMLTTQYFDANPQYGEYEKTGEYMYHVNLGLVERTKIDLATTQDVYEVTTTVNEKQETYSYNQRGVLSVFDAKLKQTSAYSEIAYTRELYNADYQLRLEDYQANSLNKLDRNGNDKTEEIETIKEIKELQYSKGGLEQRAFVTYKITLKNQSMLQNARINEITDYFDPTYKLVTEDTYQEIQNAEGIVENKLVAKQSYFIVQSDNNATEYKLTWEETGMINGMKSMYTVQSDATGLEDIMLSAKDEIYVFVTFELDKTSMDTTNRTLPLGKKQNIVEISSYSTFEIGSEDWSNSIGLIDKDSAPDNLSVGEINSYEDDTDAAPIIDFKLYSTDLRNINGYVWNDDRDVKLSTGQVVGNGVREEKEELINGVRVQLVEIVRDPQTGAEYEYVWKEMFTGEDNYKHIGSSGSITNTERGQTVSTGSIVSNTNLGAVQKGEYKFHNYIAGNFIIRFIYGDTYKTYLTAGSENAEGQGLNEASFNGHDYKSTAYLKGNNLYAEWYDLSGFDKEDKLYSDAKDDTTRRNVVIDYAATLQNDKAEILASFDDRAEKYYYDRQLHQTFRDNTWMFADTAKINVNVEYNTTKSNGLDALNYKIKNMDFGVEKRPETKLELTKEITDIKITLASGEVIVNTAAGMSQNVNWPRNQKTAIINNGKKTNYNKRDSLRYEYRQGNAHIYMDEEVMQGTNIQFTYKITVTNNSEIDYTGQNGNLGYAYYTGQVSASDRIVTTTVNKIIDYVDNSLTFRKVDSPEWDLIENMREFTTTSSGTQIEKEVMDYGTYIETMMNRYGEDYVAEHLREFEAQYQIYTQTGSLEGIGNKKPNTEEENEKGVGLSNYNVLKNMKDRTNSIGYLNEDLAIVKTKSAKVSQEPITQVIVTKALENTALKPGESASVQLILSKTLSPNDEDDTLNYGNMAEILQYSNSVGRRDMDAIPGNQQPDEDPYEYDTDFTERILITPPYGENKAIYFVLSIAVLAILTGGIILIKKKVFNN